MKARRILSGLTAVIVVGAAATVFAHDRDQEDARASLNGFHENPSISTTGRGTLELRIDTEAETIEFELRYRGLEGVDPTEAGGVVTAAHIHVSAPGVNGGVAAFLCGGGGRPACPEQPATITGTIDKENIIGPAAQGIDEGEESAFEELVRAIRNGYTYVNVHTTRFPSGEIRGQIETYRRHR